MLIYIGADHRGFKMKEEVKRYLHGLGYEIIDVGDKVYDENDDYPDFAALVGEKISEDPYGRRGILLCGSGVGVNLVANMFSRVRAALVFSTDHAIVSRTDDDTNVICLPSDFIDMEDAKKIVSVWLETRFSGEDRHRRRLEKIEKIEAAHKKASDEL